MTVLQFNEARSRGAWNMTTDVGLSPFGMGTSRLASFGSALTQKEATHLILNALDHGVTTIDTADTYGSGDSERMIGRALGQRRKECFLMTKAGISHADFPAVMSPLNQIATKVQRKFSPNRIFNKAYLLNSIEKSLKRLRTHYLDAFFLHEPLATLAEESWEALYQIRQRGLSHLTGVSTNSAEVTEQGVASGQVQIFQTPVSPAAKGRNNLLALCLKNNIPVVANEVLKPRAKLDGLGDAWTNISAHFTEGNISNPRLLIAYAASQPGVRTVLIGTKSTHHLLHNIEPFPLRIPVQQLSAEIERVLA
jgi:pyridoxine 4-dehydrogenase